MNKLASQCYQQGFQRGMAGLLKQAWNPRMATRFPIPAGRGPVNAIAAEKLLAELANPNLGPVERFLKTLQIPHGTLEALSAAGEAHAGDASRSYRNVLHRARAAARARRASGISPTLEGEYREAQNAHRRMKATYNAQRLDDMTQLGAVTEPRRKMLEVGLPIGAGVAGIGGAGAVGAGLYGRAKGKEDHAVDMSQMPLAQRMKYLFAPVRSMNQTLQ